MRLSRLIYGVILAVSLVETQTGSVFAEDAELLALVKGLQKQIEAQSQSLQQQSQRIQQLEAQRAGGSGAPGSQLEKDVALLKRQREVDQEVQIKKDAETPIVSASKDGFGLKSKDGNFQIKLKSQIQTDGRFYINDGTPAASNTFLVRRARPILEGTVFQYFDFKLMPDFGSGKAELVDAYVDFKYWKELALKAGKFKSPIGLERLQPDAVNLFPELSLASNLVPNRDLGVDLHGELFDGIMNYDAGVFNGSADNSNSTGSATADIDNHDDKDFAGRIFVLPFKNSAQDWLNGFGAGFAGSVGTAHSSALPNYKTFGQQTFFSYAPTTTADGKRFRLSPQFCYYYGPFGLLGEFVQSTQDLRNGKNTSAFKNNAGQLAASYVMTGENASYNGVIPRNDFNPSKGKWGALELVSRVDFLNADKENLKAFANLSSSAQRATGWGLGFNWYLNKNLKFSTGFEETFFDTGGLTAYGTKDRPNENALISRVQVGF